MALFQAFLLFKLLKSVISFFKRLYLFFRRRGREGERKGEKHWCLEKHPLLAQPQPGPGWQPKHVSWLKIEPMTFRSVERWLPNPLSHWWGQLCLHCKYLGYYLLILEYCHHFFLICHFFPVMPSVDVSAFCILFTSLLEIIIKLPFVYLRAQDKSLRLLFTIR